MTNPAQASQLQRSRAIIWIDHLKARVFAMGLTGVCSSIVHAHLSSTQLHHQANTIGFGRVKDDPAFLSAIAKAIEACNDVLIVGPGLEKTALMHHLQSVRPEMTLGLESSDHPTDEEIIAIGRKHFGLSERPA